jgi:hypothetical protein
MASVLANTANAFRTLACDPFLAGLLSIRKLGPFDRRRHSNEQAGFQAIWFSPRLHRLGSSDANAFLTFDWEMPTCRAVRDGGTRALMRRELVPTHENYHVIHRRLSFGES